MSSKKPRETAWKTCTACGKKIPYFLGAIVYCNIATHEELCSDCYDKKLAEEMWPSVKEGGN